MSTTEAKQRLVEEPAGSGYVMTMADAIVHAHEQVAEAERRRGVLLDQARRNGVPLRTLADMLGVSASTVQRWAGGAVGKDGPAFLDAPIVDTRRRGAA